MKNLTIFAAQIVAIAASVANAQDVLVDLTPTAEQGEVIPDVDPAELECLAEAIYFEGRNQTMPGMVAIANVILNRANSPKFPDTVCGVVQQGPMDGSKITKGRCQFSYYCDGKSDSFPVNDTPAEVRAAGWAGLAAELVLYGAAPDLSKGSTYYHADYVRPFWSKTFQKVAVVDTHVFYVTQ